MLKKEEPPQWRFSYLLNNVMVSLRGPSAKHFWDGIERFGGVLEELGVGDKEIKSGSQ